MSNSFDLMRLSISEAETTIRAADVMAVDIAEMLVGRLRSVNNKKYHPRLSDYRRNKILVALKKELSKFNSVTGEWKNG